MKTLLVAMFGGTLLLLGIAMIVLPGPAFVVIPAALAVLATRFVWAKRALAKCQSLANRLKANLRARSR